MHECACINYNFNIGIDAMHLMTLPYSHHLRLSLCMDVVASRSLVLLFWLQADRHLSLSSTQGLRVPNWQPFRRPSHANRDCEAVQLCKP